MEKYQDELTILGIPEHTDINLRELRRAFKKRSLAMLPEKHPTVANAHTQFEEVNAAFVKVILTDGLNKIRHDYSLDTHPLSRQWRVHRTPPSWRDLPEQLPVHHHTRP